MTQILRAEGAIWPNAPKIQVDGIITSGTQYVIDSVLSKQLNGSPLVSGAMPNGASIDTIPGPAIQADFVVANADGDASVSNNGVNGFSIDSADSGDGIFSGNFGAQYVNGRDFVACVWFRQKTGYSAANYQAIFTNSTDYNGGTFDISTSGLMLRAAIRGVGVYDFPSATTLDAINQIAVARQNDKFLVFKNGVLVKTADALGPTLATAGVRDGISKVNTQNTASLLNPFKGDVFRFWKEDLTISGSSVAAQVRKDWEMNKARFS